ncbi:MAG: carboxypeptidase-like regulatory domain-containing protein [Terracidiphilus sp.]
MLRLLVAVAMTLSCVTAHAQLDPPGPFHIAHLHGVYVNAKGDPISGAEVTLQQNDKIMFTTRTDRTGHFAFKHVSGRFSLRANIKGYSPLDREVIVGLEALTYLYSETLYVIAGPGACSDDCSSVFTSRDKFDKAIQRNKEHQY